MKGKRALGSALASLGLVVGFAAFAGATPYTSYGHDDHGSYGGGHATTTSSQTVSVKNTNNLGLTNTNSQTAYSGEAKVVHNTTGGSATTGNATNSNSLSASATVSNSMPAAPVMTSLVSSDHETSGSTTSKVTVDNTNNLTVTNTNNQTATTGDALVAGNTTGGSATTGAATNTNSTSVSFSVSN